MPCIKYKDIKIRGAGLALIRKINSIIAEYDEAGYSLTLRQVYYQLVARGIVPNNERSYKMVGDYVSNGRLAGLIDWYAVEDRTRFIRKLSHWNEPGEIISAAINNYRIDLWETQPQYVEIWVEKDALIGIVEQVAERFDVPCFSCRGYTSQSEMWVAAQRLLKQSNYGEREVKIIHLGDHDPSGIDMTRDIEERLKMFAENDGSSSELGTDYISINRIALNMEQIEQYNPPPNPAKITDTRSTKYIEQFGETSWELDAIEPIQLDKLIADTVEKYIDKKEMKKAKKRQEEEREQLNDAEDFVRNRKKYIVINYLGEEDGYYGGIGA